MSKLVANLFFSTSVKRFPRQSPRNCRSYVKYGTLIFATGAAAVYYSQLTQHEKRKLPSHSEWHWPLCQICSSLLANILICSRWKNLAHSDLRVYIGEYEDVFWVVACFEQPSTSHKLLAIKSKENILKVFCAATLMTFIGSSRHIRGPFHTSQHSEVQPFAQQLHGSPPGTNANNRDYIYIDSTILHNNQHPLLTKWHFVMCKLKQWQISIFPELIPEMPGNNNKLQLGSWWN
jgi:hypothetical protein